MVLCLPARAKVNLGLELVGVRPDGYHLIRSIMHQVALHDQVELSPLEGEIVLCCEPAHPSVRPWAESVPCGPQNLAWRAVEALRRAAGRPELGAAVTIRKAVPVAAGLAGGSADAAATLLGLNRLWGLSWPVERLAQVGLSLGADVPFCLVGGCALVEGVGERLTPLAPLPGAGVVLVKPPFGVSTALAYQWYDQRRAQESDRAGGQAEAALARALEAVAKQDVEQVGALLYNALEPAVATRYREIETWRRRLLEVGAFGSLMSGSGSIVFGLFRDWEAARAAAERLAGGTGSALPLPGGLLWEQGQTAIVATYLAGAE